MYSYYYFVCLLFYMFIHRNDLIFCLNKNDSIKFFKTRILYIMFTNSVIL